MQEFNAKLSDFGLAKAGPTGDRTHVSTQVMGTHGYAAPEYVATGSLSLSHTQMISPVPLLVFDFVFQLTAPPRQLWVIINQLLFLANEQVV